MWQPKHTASLVTMARWIQPNQRKLGESMLPAGDSRPAWAFETRFRLGNVDVLDTAPGTSNAEATAFAVIGER